MPEYLGPDRRAPAPTPPVDDPALPRLPARGPGAVAPSTRAWSSRARAIRAESDREALVRRRSDPWWRRILRLVVVLVILGAIMVGGFFAIDAVSGYLGRDRLPAPGVDSADVRSATYNVQYGPAVGGIAGDITVDHGGATFRFQGAADTDLDGVELVGDAAGRLALRRAGGPWELGWADQRAPQLVGLVRYLGVVDTDDVLTTTWRDGYVSIEDQESDVPAAGLEDTMSYTLSFEAARYETDHPFQWNEWVATVLPLQAVDAALLTVWVDGDGVIRQFESTAAQMRWERVTYSADTVTIDFPVA